MLECDSIERLQEILVKADRYEGHGTSEIAAELPTATTLVFGPEKTGDAVRPQALIFMEALGLGPVRLPEISLRSLVLQPTILNRSSAFKALSMGALFANSATNAAETANF